MNYQKQSSIKIDFKYTCGQDVGQVWVQKLKLIIILDEIAWVVAYSTSSQKDYLIIIKVL